MTNDPYPKVTYEYCAIGGGMDARQRRGGGVGELDWTTALLSLVVCAGSSFGCEWCFGYRRGRRHFGLCLLSVGTTL